MLKSPFRSPASRGNSSNGITVMMDVDKEITALSVWLQTFPTFDIALLREGETNVSRRLFQVLDDLETVRYVNKK